MKHTLPIVARVSGLITLAACLFAGACSAHAAATIPDEYKVGGLAIGCQSYTFNRFSAFEAIEKTAAAGGRVIEFYPGQRLKADDQKTKLEQGMSDELIAELKQKLQKHQMMAVNFGVVGNFGRDEAAARKVFEFAKKMGMPAITIEPDSTEAALDLIDKLIKEYDIKVAIHNHPRREKDPNYKLWDPNYVLSLVKSRDSRFGACADIGHFVRSGIKPIDALKTLKGRVISMHMKDLHEFKPGGHDAPFGTGVSDIPAVIDELKRQQFTGNISIEYEYNWDHSVPDVAQCIGFVRGYTSGRH